MSTSLPKNTYIPLVNSSLPRDTKKIHYHPRNKDSTMEWYKKPTIASNDKQSFMDIPLHELLEKTEIKNNDEHKTSKECEHEKENEKEEKESTASDDGELSELYIEDIKEAITELIFAHVEPRSLKEFLISISRENAEDLFLYIVHALKCVRSNKKATHAPMDAKDIMLISIQYNEMLTEMLVDIAHVVNV